MLKITKDQKLPLVKGGAKLTKIRLELSWSPPTINTTGYAYDFDISALLTDSSKTGNCDMGVSIGNQWICYWGQQNTPYANHIKGDNRNGVGVGADEIVEIDFAQIPQNADRVPCVITIDKAIAQNQCFDHCGDATAVVFDSASNTPIATIVLSKLDKGSTSALLGCFKRDSGGWTFENASTGFVDKELVDFFMLFGCEL